MQCRKETPQLLLVILCAQLLSCAYGWADDDISELPQLVVTPSKAPRSEGVVTNSVDILEENNIGGLVVFKPNIAEYLTYQPGASVRILSRNDANWGGFGGLGPKYSTFMLDGLPVDSFVEPQALDIWALERIEHQRGPASVLYPNSLGMDFAGNQSPLAGTINLLPRERVRQGKTRLALDYGSYNTVRSRAYHQDRLGKMHYFAGGQYESSDYTNYGAENSWLNIIDDPEYEKKRLYWGSTYYFNERTEHRLNIFAHFAEHDGDVGRPNREYDHRYSTLNAKYVVPFGSDYLLQLRTGYRRYDRSWQEDFYPDSLALASDNTVLQNIVPVDVALSFTHGQGSLFTFGADGQYVDYKTESNTGIVLPGNNAESLQAGLYAQEELVMDDIILRGGGRLSWTEQKINLLDGAAPGDDNQSWDEVLWSAGIRYHGGSMFSPFGNIGTSFVVPGIKSVGGTLNSEDLGVSGRHGQLPNPDLKPENGIGADIGSDFFFAQSSSKFTVRGFWSRVDDAIVENVVSENPSQSQSVNAGELEVYGIEVGLRHYISDTSNWFANYTYTDSRINNPIDLDQDDVQTPFVPKQTANLGFITQMPADIKLSSQLHLTDDIYDSSSLSSRRSFEGYALLNAKLEKQIVLKGKAAVSAYLEFYNITDKKFEMPWQFRDPGFSMLGGVKAEL